MPEAHAKLSPSAGKRWLRCPGSVAASEVCVKTSSRAADEGTAGHDIFATAVTQQRDPQEWLGKTMLVKGSSVTVSQELVDWVKEAVAWVERYKRDHPRSILHSEVEVDIGLAFGLSVGSDGKTPLWGTSDLFIVTGEELVTFDLKLGYHDVAVGDNEQLYLYSIGFEHDYSAFDFERVRHVIHQPRSGGAKEEVVPITQLRAWREEQLPRVHEALDPTAPRRPSEAACAWCPAQPVCPALHEEAMALAKAEFAAVDTLSEEQLGALLQREKMISSLLKSARSHALHLLRLGRSIPGFKLVNGKRDREWGDEEGARQFLLRLGHDPYRPQEMVSPAQAEKLVGKGGREALARFVVQPVGEVTIAPESDRRPAVAAEFTPIDENGEEVID